MLSIQVILNIYFCVHILFFFIERIFNQDYCESLLRAYDTHIAKINQDYLNLFHCCIILHISNYFTHKNKKISRIICLSTFSSSILMPILTQCFSGVSYQRESSLPEAKGGHQQREKGGERKGGEKGPEQREKGRKRGEEGGQDQSED